MVGMPRVVFTRHLARHVSAPETVVEGRTVREVLAAVFTENPAARGYVLDDQGGPRKHVAIFVDGEPIKDREGLSDAIGEGSEVYVLQALSGG